MTASERQADRIRVYFKSAIDHAWSVFHPEEDACIADLDALVAEMEGARNTAYQALALTSAETDRAEAAEAERDAIDEAAKRWRLDIEAELVQLRAEVARLREALKEMGVDMAAWDAAALAKEDTDE